VRIENRDDPPRSTGVTRTPDGFVELWFDSVAKMEVMYRSEFAHRRVADAEHFVAATATFVVDERAIKAPAR